MVSKYGYLMLPGTFPDIESYPWYWFYRWSNSSVLCYSCKNTIVGAMVGVMYKLSQINFDLKTYGGVMYSI